MCPQRNDTRDEARRARSGSGLLNVGDAMTGERVSRGARREAEVRPRPAAPERA